MQIDSFLTGKSQQRENEAMNLTELLDALLDDAYERGVLEENSVVYRDLFDTKLMGMPDTTSVAGDGQSLAILRKESSQRATDWYYQFSQDTNYIRKDRVAKDIQWKTDTEYGEIGHFH